MKSFSKLLFAAYLLTLLWLVMFKLSYDPVEVLRSYQTRSVNLVPFTRAHRSEMISNFVAFIPFGVMLGLSFKRTAFLRKLAAVFLFSLAVEIVQFVLAIGVTDVTDVITNTLGGLAGLAGYTAAGRLVRDTRLDRAVVLIGAILLLAMLFLRLFVFVVRY